VVKRKEEEQDIKMIYVKDLLLDYENPRLSTAGEVTSQEQLLKQLYMRYDLDPLIYSLSENGYFSEEPLIAVEKKVGTEVKFMVVEGNRRLAALKILLFDDDRKSAGAKGIPKPSKEVLARLNPIPVKVYASRDEIVSYLGVRHIVGVKPWDALSKAKYIEQLVKKGSSLDEVKEIIGMKRGDVVQRWLLALYVVNQANSIADEPWQEASKDFKFSFLYTSLGYQSVRNYLGLDNNVIVNPKPNPVPKKSRENLIDHMKDLYGPPGRPELHKVKESRKISELASVYATTEALDVLRAGAPLEEAYSRSRGEAVVLLDLVRGASYKLDEANAIATHHKKNPEVRKFAKRCLDSAQHLYETLED